MRRQRQGIQSMKNTTTMKTNVTHFLRDMHPVPTNEKNVANLFFHTMIVENKHGKNYVDLTRNFPLCSIDGMKTIFILYDWSSNAILATPISATTENVIIETFTENIKNLESRGFRPQYNIMDNVASNAIKKFLEKEKKLPTSRATQSSGQRSRASNPNLQKSLYLRFMCMR